MSTPSWKEQFTLTITDTDVCGRDAKFVLPAEASTDLFLTAAKGVARKAQIPGFRRSGFFFAVFRRNPPDCFSFSAAALK